MENLHRRLAILWLLCLCFFVAVVVQQLNGNKQRFVSDITYLLPGTYQNKGQQLYQKNLKKLANDQLLMMIRLDKKLGSKERSVILENTRKLVMQSGFFTFLEQQKHLNTWQAFYANKQYQLLSIADQFSLKKSPELWQSKLLAHLYQPFAIGLGNSYLEDPLAITRDHLMRLVPSQAVGVEDGFIKTEDDKFFYYLCRLQLRADVYDLSYQKNVAAWIKQQQITNTNAIAFSGLIYHASYASQLAKKEMSSIGLISLLGITLLLLLLSRSLLKPLILLLPIFAGFLFALAICLLVFDSLHSVVLVFGAALIGVAIDYSLHYYLAHKEVNKKPGFSISRLNSLRVIIVGLFIGLVSTLLAYAAQAIPPFPGLRQMSFFAIMGLTGAWLTVVLWFPYLLKKQVCGLGVQTEKNIANIYNFWPNLPSKNVSYLAVLLIGILGVLLWFNFSINDDLQQLNTSSAEMIQDEKNIQEKFSQYALGQYFIIEGGSAEQLLRRSEKLTQQLIKVKQQQSIKNFLCLSHIVPSLESQQGSYTLLEKQFYGDKGIFATVFAGEDYTELLAQLRHQFSELPFKPVTLLDYQQANIDAMSKQLYVGQVDGIHYGVCQIVFTEYPDISVMASMAQQLEGVNWVNQSTLFSHLLKEYRQSLLLWVGLAYFLVLFVLYFRYGFSAWRIVFVPAFASLSCLLILSLSGVDITLFHLLALLLILGIGLDANIFMTESNASVYTYLAVSSALLSSLLAFGLLAFSQTPILHFIGQTVFIGLLLVWLLTPSMVLRK